MLFHFNGKSVIMITNKITTYVQTFTLKEYVKENIQGKCREWWILLRTGKNIYIWLFIFARVRTQRILFSCFLEGAHDDIEVLKWFHDIIKNTKNVRVYVAKV